MGLLDLVGSLAGAAVTRADSWVNTLTGMGDRSRDKTESTGFSAEGWLDDETLEVLYNENPMAAKLCDAPGDHMLRQGFKIVIPDNPALGEEITAVVKTMNVAAKVKEALAWSRCFGGGLIVMGADDGQDPSEPLNCEAIKSVSFLNALDRRYVWPVYWYADPNSPKFGTPEVYRITYLVQGSQRPGTDIPTGANRTFEIHESRLALFMGSRATMRTRLMRGGWGNSVLSRCYRSLRSYDSVWNNVEALTADASQGVYKLKNLLQMIASNGEAFLIKRLRVMDMARSTMRSIVIDADTESFERKDTSMSGLPDLVDRVGVRLSAVADVPVTVLLGISPAGLNATGESDLKLWYDSLSKTRAAEVDPALRQVVRTIMLAKDSPTGGVEPKEWSIEYEPLWQETAQEKAATELAQAQKDAIYLDKQVVIPEQVAVQRAKSLGIDPKPYQAAIDAYEKKLASGEGDLPAPGGVGSDTGDKDNAETDPLRIEQLPTA